MRQWSISAGKVQEMQVDTKRLSNFLTGKFRNQEGKNKFHPRSGDLDLPKKSVVLHQIIFYQPIFCLL